MKKTIIWFFLLGFLLIGSAVVLAQTTGQPAAPPASPTAPPATPAPAEPPAVQPPAPPAVQPAPPPGAPAKMHKGADYRFFNPNTVETVSGKVVKVQRGPMRTGGKGNFVRFTLKTDKGLLPIFLGPASYVDKQALKLAAGDTVQVKGSLLTGPKGKSAITAVEVSKGDHVLKLRDDQGKPVWPQQHRKARRVVQPQSQ